MLGIDIHQPGHRLVDKSKFEEFKSRFYRFQGWDTESGYPTRKALESMELGYVADELGKNGKLGEPSVA